jgi:hypothetical protein
LLQILLLEGRRWEKRLQGLRLLRESRASARAACDSMPVTGTRPAVFATRADDQLADRVVVVGRACASASPAGLVSQGDGLDHFCGVPHIARQPDSCRPPEMAASPTATTPPGSCSACSAVEGCDAPVHAQARARRRTVGAHMTRRGVELRFAARLVTATRA